MFEWIIDPNAWLSLLTLIFLEVILGIDNIIFLSLIVEKLPQYKQNLGRKLGLAGAMLIRIALLASLAWITKLIMPICYFYPFGILKPSADVSQISSIFALSARDIILFIGGVFLVWKGILEIKEMFHADNHEKKSHKSLPFFKAIIQIMILDIVFSLDSVITAVGLSDHLFIMVLAVILAVIIMMFSAKCIGTFINNNPSIKMLAVVFLVMVGGVLMIDSFHYHIPKGYIYFAIFFSLTVEILNLLKSKKQNSISGLN